MPRHSKKLPSHVGTKLLVNTTKSVAVRDRRIHLLVLGNLKILNSIKRLWFWNWTTSSNPKSHSPFVPPLNTDIVFRTITLAHVPKITPAPTPMFVKSVQVNTGANSAQDSNKINLSKPKITVQMPLSPPLQLESNISTPIKHSLLTSYLEGYDQTF